MIERKIFVLVIDDKIRCYHNLKQLANSNNLPYVSISRHIHKGEVYKKDNMLVGCDTISYKTKRMASNLN